MHERVIGRRERGTTFALAVLCLVGCPAPAPMVTAVEVPEGPRHPDGVLIEPPAPIPPALDRAPARGVVALREPLADEAIRDVVRQYIRAWIAEDLSALEALFTPEATSLDAAHLTRAAMREVWRSRTTNLDFKKLAGSEVARFDRIERYELAEVGVPGAPAKPPEMRQGDVLARIPIATPRVGAEQLFPETLVLLLRREEGKFKIAGIGEENGP